MTTPTNCTLELNAIWGGDYSGSRHLIKPNTYITLVNSSGVRYNFGIVSGSNPVVTMLSLGMLGTAKFAQIGKGYTPNDFDARVTIPITGDEANSMARELTSGTELDFNIITQNCARLAAKFAAERGYEIPMPNKGGIFNSRALITAMDAAKNLGDTRIQTQHLTR